MSSIFKKIFIFFTIITFLLAFSNSYNSLTITNLVLFVALGIDIADDGDLLVTFQYSSSSSVSESGETEETPTEEYTIKASSISNAINLMSTYTGKEISLSHCKVIVFSYEIAKRGISEEIYTLINDSQVRPSTNIVVSKCLASEYISSTEPIFENLITKYYEVFVDSSKYSGYLVNATIGEFFDSLISDTSESYAILGNISSLETDEASLLDFSGTTNTGIAVFKDDTLVGELDSLETLAFLATKNEITGFLISVSDPTSNTSDIDIYITPNTNSKITSTIVNGSPYVQIDYSFTGSISSANEASEYLEVDVINDISILCNTYLEDIFTNYLYTTSKVLNSDITDIGKTFRSCFLTLTDFYNYDWKSKFSSTFFNVSVSTNIRSRFFAN